MLEIAVKSSSLRCSVRTLGKGKELWDSFTSQGRQGSDLQRPIAARKF